MRSSRLARTVAAGALTASMIGLTACSGDGGSTVATGGASATPVSAEEVLLTAAATTLDSTKAVRLRLRSSEVPKTGTKLVSGQGTMVRTGTSVTGVSAGAFRGVVSIVLAGNRVTVPVVSVGGKVYAQVPPQSRYQVMDLAGFGIGDPAKLLDPDTGLAQLFSKLTGVTAGDDTTVAGTPAKQVEGTVPGTMVAQILASADSSRPVMARLAIDPATNQLRRVVLVGPFFTKKAMSTYTLNLDRYGVVVPIKAPAV